MTQVELKRALGKQRAPSMAPLQRKERFRRQDRLLWQLRVWREATGREQPSQVDGPLLPLDEAGRVMIALKRRKSLDLYARPERIG